MQSKEKNGVQGSNDTKCSGKEDVLNEEKKSKLLSTDGVYGRLYERATYHCKCVPAAVEGNLTALIRSDAVDQGPAKKAANWPSQQTICQT